MALVQTAALMPRMLTGPIQVDATFTLLPCAGSVCLVIEGELDLAAHGQLTQRLAEAADLAHGTLRLDLSRVTFVDCCGLRPIEEIRLGLEAAGGRLEIAASSACFRRVSLLAGYAELGAEATATAEPSE